MPFSLHAPEDNDLATESKATDGANLRTLCTPGKVNYHLLDPNKSAAPAPIHQHAWASALEEAGTVERNVAQHDAGGADGGAAEASTPGGGDVAQNTAQPLSSKLIELVVERCNSACALIDAGALQGHLLGRTCHASVFAWRLAWVVAAEPKLH